MSEYRIKKETLSAIGDAIRDKEDSSSLIPVPDLADRISALWVVSELTDAEDINI